MITRFFCAGVLAAGIGGAATAEILHVPSEYSMSEAIAEWDPGDEIVVAPGEYNPVYVYRPVYMRSAEGPEVTTINGHTTSHALQYVAAGQGIIDGFTMTGGGHGIRIDGGTPSVRNCIFRDNHSGAGGGAYVRGGQPTFENCLFKDNEAMGAQGGGAYAQDAASMTFVNCRFIRNITNLWGGAATSLSGPMTFVNCMFVGNSADHLGGAIYAAGPLTVMDCTFAGNTAGSGGAIHEVDHVARIANSILCLNSPDQVSAAGTGSFQISYTDIEQDGYLGAGNINADPRFIDELGPDEVEWTGDEDLRLDHYSPCIDAGDNAEIGLDLSDIDRDGNMVEPIPFDLDLLPRRYDDAMVADTGLGDPPVVDMGAYERQQESECLGDVDGGGEIDFNDLLDVLSWWGPCPGCPQDLDGDDEVGFSDLLLILSYWGPCPV